ncbi:MAG: S-methylmethionine-dependent homocysteine/selenocysteine methylase [Gammaproteobacteria bacterium]|jgi:S-methylmethionine-dependent homocysteine/selenocysteine methylase
MDRYQNILHRLQSGQCILMDGGTGTELERRGVPQLDHAWNGGGALSHPDILREIHEDYLRFGAEVIISNTFATHYYALRDAGVENRFNDYNRRSVELAIEARDNQNNPAALVAGGMSYWSWTGNHPALDDLKSAAFQQVGIMAEAGADLIMLEMMIDIDKMLVLLEVARSTGLPVWIGITCEPDNNGVICLRNGEPLIDALKCIDKNDVDMINIMHTEIEYIDASLDVLKAHWQGPFGVYAHSGQFVDNKIIFSGTISPENYCMEARRWADKGAQIIGGCCGIEPRHIEQLSKIM